MVEKVRETSNRGTGVMEGTTRTDGGKGKRNKQQRNWSYGRPFPPSVFVVPSITPVPLLLVSLTFSTISLCCSFHNSSSSVACFRSVSFTELIRCRSESSNYQVKKSTQHSESVCSE